MMNAPPIPPRDWRNLGTRYALLWLACFQMVFWWGEWTAPFTLLCSLAYPALLLWAYSLPVVQTLWNATGRFTRLTAAALLVLMVNAQLLRRDELTYPIAAWTMFSSRHPDALEFIDLVGVRANGTRARLKTDTLMTATTPCVARLGEAHAQIIRTAPSAPESAARRRANLEATLAELGRRQVRHAGESTFTRVELVKRTLGPDGEPTGTTVLVAVDLPPAQGGP